MRARLCGKEVFHVMEQIEQVEIQLEGLGGHAPTFGAAMPSSEPSMLTPQRPQFTPPTFDLASPAPVDAQREALAALLRAQQAVTAAQLAGLVLSGRWRCLACLPWA